MIVKISKKCTLPEGEVEAVLGEQHMGSSCDCYLKFPSFHQFMSATCCPRVEPKTITNEKPVRPTGQIAVDVFINKQNWQWIGHTFRTGGNYIAWNAMVTTITE